MAEAEDLIGLHTPNVCLELISVTTVPVTVVATSNPDAGRENCSQDC